MKHFGHTMQAAKAQDTLPALTGGGARVSPSTVHMQRGIARQSSLHTLHTALNCLFLLCMLANLFTATRSIPYLKAITVALVRSGPQLAELALVAACMICLFAVLLNTQTDTDERMAALRYLVAYTLTGTVTGTCLQACIAIRCCRHTLIDLLLFLKNRQQ